MGDDKVSFFVLDLILLIVLIGLVSMIFGFRGIPFYAELFFVVVVIFLAFISLIGIFNSQNWGFVMLSIIFAAILADLLLIYYLKRSFDANFVLTTIFSALGFIITVAGIKRKKEIEEAEEVTKSFEPGKYVASKTGTTYHAPTCDWAKKIKKANQLWFDDEGEAKDKGYKKHSCLEVPI